MLEAVEGHPVQAAGGGARQRAAAVRGQAHRRRGARQPRLPHVHKVLVKECDGSVTARHQHSLPTENQMLSAQSASWHRAAQGAPPHVAEQEVPGGGGAEHRALVRAELEPGEFPSQGPPTLIGHFLPCHLPSVCIQTPECQTFGPCSCHQIVLGIPSFDVFYKASKAAYCGWCRIMAHNCDNVSRGHIPHKNLVVFIQANSAY
mmetsp:Transcript_14059/g.23577  ORF Transcript_14059/g.23577 Transcript_14059/m.23577 type:complete len:204 (+) Transcript_14059:94-705(+)